MDEPSAELLARYRDGDDAAAAEMFRRYVERLTRLARARLSPRLARRVDPEDVVLSAWRSFFVAARDGRFTLRHGGDLWKLLVTITLRKVARQAAHHTAGCRSFAAEQNCAPETPSREPTPAEAAAVSDELERLMATLSPVERRVLELRLQDYQIDEIAEDVGRSERTVRRALDLIRRRLGERQ